jgi:hypothetical protein
MKVGFDGRSLDCVQFFYDNLHWNTIFTKPVHDWEVESVTLIFSLLYSLKLRQNASDKIHWIPSKRLTLEVRSLPPLELHILRIVFGE